MSEKSKCRTCGFEWEAGKSGYHTCSDSLNNKIDKLQKRCEFAEQLLWDIYRSKDGAEDAVREHVEKYING